LAIREIIEELFPDKYLGAMPIILSHEISPTSGEYPRSMAAILNAYMHRDLSDELRSLGDEMRRQGYKKPVVVVRNTGAVSKVLKTSALETYASGPVAGLLGGARVCQAYDIPNAIMTDMGGTSFDIGLIVDGTPGFYHYRPVIEHFFVSLPMLEVATIGAGGGSIASVESLLKRLKVGPRSAGAMPGPVCYDLGGREPTVTDADLLLGYINPDRFCGGQIKLNKERTELMMEQHIAKPQGITVAEAAAAIRGTIDGRMGNEIFKEIALRGLNPKDFVMFAYGGAGPTHATGYTPYLGMNGPIYVFPFSPVFCAFGSAVSDIAHLYQIARHMVLVEGETDKILLDFDDYNRAVEGLIEEAQKDIIEDGFDPQTAIYSLELEMRYGSQIQNTIITSPVIKINGEEDARSIQQAFTKRYIGLWGPGSAYPQGGVEIDLFRVRAIIPTGDFELKSLPMSGSDPSDAKLGNRDAWWDGDFLSTPVYEGRSLVPGNVLSGPALVETDTTTIVVPKQWEYRIDQYGTGILG
jgi:N-methylhydantoinase A/acetophenone carboxylase